MPMKRPVRCWKPGILVKMRRASGGVNGAGALEGAREDAVGEDLHALGIANGAFTVVSGRFADRARWGRR